MRSLYFLVFIRQDIKGNCAEVLSISCSGTDVDDDRNITTVRSHDVYLMNRKFMKMLQAQMIIYLLAAPKKDFRGGGDFYEK